MTDRRRASRYVLDTPLRGHARPMQDAVVEEVSADRIVVIASSARRVHEDIVVHLPMPTGVERYAAQVVESTPVSLDGTLNFRLTLRISS